MSNTAIGVRTQRLSNVELLRLVAMFGVLIVHADFGALHEPSRAELLATPLYGYTRIIIESFALVAVNVFVLISGWFGITFKWKGVANLLFQTFFFFFLIYGVLVCTGRQEFGLGGIYKCLMLSDNAWFVKAYLGMYIFAPALNEMVRHVPKKTLEGVLISFFVFQSIYGWFSDGASWINMGYSSFSFMGLYCLARYVRMYHPGICCKSRGFDAAVYTCCSMVTAVAIAVLVWRENFLWSRFMYYTSPFVIAASLYLLLAFTKWTFRSSMVNKIAVSCFAVYLMHFMIFPTYMRPAIQRIAESYDGLMMLLLETLLLVVFFCVAILVDRVRLYIWNRFLCPLLDD